MIAYEPAKIVFSITKEPQIEVSCLLNGEENIAATRKDGKYECVIVPTGREI